MRILVCNRNGLCYKGVGTATEMCAVLLVERSALSGRKVGSFTPTGAGKRGFCRYQNVEIEGGFCSECLVECSEIPQACVFEWRLSPEGPSSRC